MSQKVPCYLRTLRRGWGLTQEEVAALLPRTSRHRVARVERGECPPNGREIIAYALIFGSPATKVFARLQVKVEECVIQRAYRFHERLAEDETRSGRRKRELMEKMLARAIIHVKGHEA